MNWDAIGAAGEILGGLAVLITLFYLARQIRQNTETVRTSAEMDVSKLSAEWVALAINNPEIGKIWDKAADDPKSLSDSEIRLFLWFVLEYLLLSEAQYYLYIKGHVTEESWHVKASLSLGMIKNPIVRKWWSTGLGPLSPRFRKYVDDHIEEDDLSWKYASVAKAGRLDG